MEPYDVTSVRDYASGIASPLRDHLVADICRRIKKAGAITTTAEYEIYRAEALGMAAKDLKAAIAEQSGINAQAIDILFGDLIDKSVRFEDNGQLRQLAAAYAQITKHGTGQLLKNLWAPGPDGKLYTIKEAYSKIMDFAFGQVMTGTTDISTAMRQATKELVKRGIRSIPRKNGSSLGVEYATRSYIMNRMGAMSNAIQQMNHDKLGCDGWEISAHSGPAPDHAPIQGQQYSDAEYKALNDGLPRAIGDWHCKHIVWPVKLGRDKPTYTKAKLQRMLDDNERVVSYQGQHYTLYEAGQRQAELEAQIINIKHRVLADKALGDGDMLRKDQVRLARMRQEYARYCDGVGLKPRSARLQAAGFGRSEASRASTAARKIQRAPVTKDMLQQLSYLGPVPAAERKAIEAELALLPDRMRVLAETRITGVRLTTDVNSSGYKRATGEIFLSPERPEGAVIHEYAHGLETALDLYNDPAFLSIRNKGLENISLADILEDEDTFTEPIFRVKSKKLVSDYQGRLYTQYGIYDGKTVSLEGMREYFSEGLRVYCTDPQLLQKRDPDLFNYIKELAE